MSFYVRHNNSIIIRLICNVRKVLVGVGVYEREREREREIEREIER